MFTTKRMAELTALAAHTPCPFCAQASLEFVLRCDLSYGSCLYTAHCATCDSSFEIVVGDEDPDIEEVSEVVAPCPTCGGSQRQAALHCSTETHECVYTLDCPTCDP